LHPCTQDSASNRFISYSQGQQKGLRGTNLRGIVEVDPRRDDLFRRMVEQNQVYKKSDEALSHFLKICANSTSYGMFFELTPQKQAKLIKVRKRLLEMPLAFLEFETGLSRHTVVRARGGQPVQVRSLRLLKEIVRRAPLRE
jgi:hypothetical protein